MRMHLVTRVWFGTMFALLIHDSASAQNGTITGTVRSSETGAPLISAVVQVTDAGGGRVASVLTNQTGRFQLTTIPAGTYTVTANMTGFATGRSDAVPVGAGQTTTTDFDLVPRAIDLDPITATASRREERALDAPARVEVVTPQAIEDRPTIQPVDHLQGVPGVDIVNQGIQSTNVVARGFNNIFSGALLALSDHRIAAIPSLRVNSLHLIPANNEDIERIEVVLGPGSALYGPNTANGVLHMFTRSPLTYQGTTLTATGGERSIFHGTFRTAHLLGENLGVKLSGEYLTGEEWKFEDPVEQQARAAALPTNPATRIGLRDFGVERWALDGRMDYRIRSDATLILSAGRTTAVKNLEMTGIGASQVRDWAYSYYQSRFNWNRLFAQAYLTTSDAGETFRLRDEAPTIDNSRFFAAQVQHGFTPVNWQNFTYGIDYLRTMPDTEGTIHGRYEDDDVYSETGVFLQSETTINRQFELVLAGRLDNHSVVDETVFSPRAALVFKPSPNHTLRGSFNKAYSNPGSVQLFLDLGAGPAGALGPLGYRARALGTGREGLQFRAEDGRFYMRSPFGAAAGQAGTPAEGMQLREINLTNVWQQQVRGIARALRLSGTFPSDPVAAAFVDFMLGQQPSDMPIFGFNSVTNVRAPFTEPANVPGVRESNVTSYEVGYKGLLGGRLLLAADVWYTQRDNFISPLLAQTPFIMLQPDALEAYARPRIQGFLMNAFGLPEAQAQAAAAQIAGGMKDIPGGVVTIPGMELGPEVLVSYRNFGDIDLWGADLSAQGIWGNWNFGISTSLVSDDHFETEGQLIALNAPARKGAVSVGYRDEERGFNTEARVRYNGEFPAQSGTYVGLRCILPPEQITPTTEPCVESSTVADVTLGYRLPRVPRASLQLTVQNLFDERYRSFIGAPEIGRMALLRLRYDL